MFLDIFHTNNIFDKLLLSVKKSLNSRKLKCAVVCAEQPMQSGSESPKRVCGASREVTRCIGGQGRGIVSVTASIHRGRM
jgi:hypothetical protein